MLGIDTQHLISLICIVLPIILIEEAIQKLFRKRKEKNAEQRENEMKAKLGLPGEEYETFSRMDGAGVITCRECGHKEKIISFTHGAYSCEIGRQCPHCHAFVPNIMKAKNIMYSEKLKKILFAQIVGK